MFSAKSDFACSNGSGLRQFGCYFNFWTNIPKDLKMLQTVPIAVNYQTKLTEGAVGPCSGDTCYFQVILDNS